MLHFHRCPTCGCIWKHGEESRENEDAHLCPECGEEQCLIEHKLTSEEREAARFHGVRK